MSVANTTVSGITEVTGRTGASNRTGVRVGGDCDGFRSKRCDAPRDNYQRIAEGNTVMPAVKKPVRPRSTINASKSRTSAQAMLSRK